jgi:hypothetical protein
MSCVDYPLLAPASAPLVRKRWAKMKTSATGTIVITPNNAASADLGVQRESIEQRVYKYEWIADETAA